MLCGNNFAIYESYKKAYKEIETLSISNNEIYLANSCINTQLDELKEENEMLRRSYFKIVDRNEELIKIKEELMGINEKLTLENNELTNQNDELSMKNKELTKDNIALENSLKMAASAGIKPQNYTLFEGLKSNDIIEKGQIERGQYIGKFSGTAYTPSVEECGNNKGITNSGQPIIPGVSIAIDPKYWPFGTIFYIKGLGYTIAMDTGNLVKGKYRFDFAVFDKEFARTLGMRKWDVYLVKMGNGTIEDKTFSFLY